VHGLSDDDRNIEMCLFPRINKLPLAAELVSISGGAKSINTGQEMVSAMKGTVGICSFGLHEVSTFDIGITSQSSGASSKGPIDLGGSL
jgi:hypothetical protein